VNRRPLFTSLLASFLVVGALVASLATGATPKLGLDLEGGVSVIYTPVLTEGEEKPDDFEAILDETVEVIRSRIDSLGVAEPDITRQGEEILVQLPGIDDESRIQDIIGRTAKLTFRRVEAILQPGDEGYDDTAACDEEQLDINDAAGLLCEAGTEVALEGGGSETISILKYRVSEAQIQGSQIDSAFATINGSAWVVSLDLDNEGAALFETITSDLACERDLGQPGLFAIVLDGRVFSAPAMNPSVLCNFGIAGGQASITVGGGISDDGGEQEAGDLALVLRTGALPITLVNQDFRTVSPTLGAESLDAGLLAAGIGLLLVAIYLIAFYRWLGVVAIASLAIFGTVITGLLGLLGKVGFSLTLAGIAGIVVSIGITADSSILFFERIRDEVRLGKTVRTAVQRAFESAFRTNLAGNTVTLAAAIILYFLAIGPVRGFALTLGIATVLDILILFAFTRPVVFLMSTTKMLRRDTIRVTGRTTSEVAS
jgi:preprotein translocase subunit SecD